MSESGLKLTERQQRLLDHLHRCEASERSLKAYAESEGLRVRDLYSAKQELARKGVGVEVRRRPRFVRARIVPGGERIDSVRCRVQLPNGCVVEIGCSGQALQAVLEAVGRLK